MHARIAAVIGAAAALAAAARGPGAALLAAARAPGAPAAALAAAGAALAAAACASSSAARPAAAAAAGARVVAAATAAYTAAAPAAANVSAAGARLAAAAGAALAAASASVSAAASAASSAAPFAPSAASPSATASPAACAAASDRVLRSALRTPFRSYVREGLYTVELPAPPRRPGAAAPPARTLVLLHGYGMGSAMWAPALDSLAAEFKVYAVDLRGCGASERPAWPRAGRDGGGRVGVEEAEAWFVDALERWRAASGAELAAPAVLAGHSLGGYVAAAFALRHPARVGHLVLVSPAGVPPAPAPGSEEARRFEERVASHWLLKPLSWAWESGVTPQGLVSAAGPWARARVGEVFERRFGERMQAGLDSRAAGAGAGALDRAALVEYLYLINSTAGSGDAALSALLSFGAVARSAIGPRLVALAASEGATKAPPTTFIYGRDFDWMPAQPGFDVVKELRERGVDAACLLTPRAGHNLFLDQPDAFVEQVVARCA
jgi:pimeloyl-ACP methyl ester carboxylesterase